MSITYENAPLVELIAELRWGPGGDEQPSGDPSTMFALPSPKDEELMLQFGAVFAHLGYGRFERLLPPGMPAPYGQVAMRCRPTDSTKSAPLFQLGHGVFTANALPPYKSWADFRPLVGEGVESLFTAFKNAGKSPPQFHTAFVRYIDAFTEEFTGDRDVRTFLREVMGLDISLPEIILSQAANSSDIEPMLHLVIPSKRGRIELRFGEGRQGNERAILMDMSVLIQRKIGADIELALSALTDGRQVIHELFRGLTESLHEQMKPLS